LFKTLGYINGNNVGQRVALIIQWMHSDNRIVAVDYNIGRSSQQMSDIIPAGVEQRWCYAMIELSGEQVFNHQSLIRDHV